MSVYNKIKNNLSEIWNIDKNRLIIKDVLLLFVATIIFHFLYWHGNMNTWIFGPFTNTIYDFFRNLAFNVSVIPCKAFINKPFDIAQTTFYFYDLAPNGIKIYNQTMEINIDCSGVKQLLQFLLIMILCRGNWWKKSIYYIIGCFILLFFNVVRVFFLTLIFSDKPELFQPIHDWIARPMMYVIIFLLWWIWINFFATTKQKIKK